MSLTTTTTRPSWYRSVPADRKGVWNAGDNKFSIAGQTLSGYPVRVILTDGTVFDGRMGDERNRWDAKHSIAIRIPGRKSQKWIKRSDIATIWADKGPSLEVLLTAFIEKTHNV